MFFTELISSYHVDKIHRRLHVASELVCIKPHRTKKRKEKNGAMQVCGELEATSKTMEG
jgi:hypothetical protein